MIKAQLSQEQNKFAHIVLSHSERDLTENDCKIVEEALKGWRKYPEEKPKREGTYLCKYESGFHYECEYSGNEFVNPHTVASVDKLVTHWMPIPEIGELDY